jgi:hypothetical protein
MGVNGVIPALVGISPGRISSKREVGSAGLAIAAVHSATCFCSIGNVRRRRMRRRMAAISRCGPGRRYGVIALGSPSSTERQGAETGPLPTDGPTPWVSRPAENLGSLRPILHHASGTRNSAGAVSKRHSGTDFNTTSSGHEVVVVEQTRRRSGDAGLWALSRRSLGSLPGCVTGPPLSPAGCAWSFVLPNLRNGPGTNPRHRWHGMAWHGTRMLQLHSTQPRDILGGHVNHRTHGTNSFSVLTAIFTIWTIQFKQIAGHEVLCTSTWE